MDSQLKSQTETNTQMCTNFKPELLDKYCSNEEDVIVQLLDKHFFAPQYTGNQYLIQSLVRLIFI